MSRRIEVKVVGDTSSLERAFARLAAAPRRRNPLADVVERRPILALVAVPLALALLIGWLA